MTENAQIALIVVAGFIFVLAIGLWMFKDRLDIFKISASKKKVTATMERHKNTGISISKNIQVGNENEITATTSNASIEENEQHGNKNRIDASSLNKTSKKNS